MTKLTPSRKTISRRSLFKIGGGAAIAAAGAHFLPSLLQPTSRASAASPKEYHLAATDGWLFLPGSVPTFHPDPWAPPPLTTYTFGFRDVTGLTDGQVEDQRGRVQAPAPVLWGNQEEETHIKLTNLGFALRPDLTDGHTIHFHGFRNAIPLYDGVPEMSIAVPTGRNFTYIYRPHDPGTYMYHCHFEDVEHVSMGMTGVVFVRPVLGPNYAYNDPATAFDREYPVLLTELWTQERFEAVHIQEHDWSDYKPDYWLMNGRSYPDTLEPNGDPMAPANEGTPLQFQPISSLITANVGQKVLLRFVNLGYQQQAMKLDGLNMRVVGKDATLLRGLDSLGVRGGPGSADLSYETDTIYIGPGESYDAIFTASAAGTYLLYNRNYAYLNNGGSSSYGGQMTKVIIS